MPMVRCFIVSVAVVGPQAITNTHALACSCDGLPSVEQILEQSDAVFLGTLIAQEADYIPQFDERPDRDLVFHVLAAWKGVSGTELGAVTVAGGTFAGCGFWGRIGREYLVWGALDPNTDRLRIDLCSFRSQDFDESIEHLDLLADRIELTPGNDPQFVPQHINNRLCGLGGLQILGLMLPAFFHLRFGRHRLGR